MAESTDLREAISDAVKPGTSLYITGFTHLINFAAAHEIIRLGIKDLTLIRLTPDVVYDQMVGAGVAKKLVFSYLGNPGVGNLHAIRRAIEGGDLEWDEYTHGSLIAALRAGASGLPFAPVEAVGRTDLHRYNDAFQFVTCPFTEQETAVVRPLRPDVAIVHVQRADRNGNAQVWGSVGDIREAAHAAQHVIVTAEEIVDEDLLRTDPNRTVMLGLHVDRLVEAPWAAHPSYAQGSYARDNQFYRRWAELSSTPEGVEQYLQEEVFGVDGRQQYLELHRERALELSRVGELMSSPVNFGDNAAIAAVQEQ